MTKEQVKSAIVRINETWIPRYSQMGYKDGNLLKKWWYDTPTNFPRRRDLLVYIFMMLTEGNDEEKKFILKFIEEERDMFIDWIYDMSVYDSTKDRISDSVDVFAFLDVTEEE